MLMKASQVSYVVFIMKISFSHTEAKPVFTLKAFVTPPLFRNEVQSNIAL